MRSPLSVLVDDYLTKPVPLPTSQGRSDTSGTTSSPHCQPGIAVAAQGLERSLEEHRAERTRELIDARDDAMEASRLKSQFLANMSHEIRTPMNGVLGAAELLARRARSGSAQLCRDPVAVGQSLLAIINNILDFSKVEAGHLEVRVTLRCWTHSTTSSICSRPKPPQRTVTQLHHSGLPTTTIGDAVRLRQVITNLVGTR